MAPADLRRRVLAVAWLLLAAAVPAQPVRPDPAVVSRLIVAQTNDLRATHGLGRVEAEGRLGAAARAFAEYMARTERYGHDADGSSPAQRAQAHGYDHCKLVENIAYLMSSRGSAADELARSVVEGWKGSAGHRKNMLDRDVVDIGVAIAQSPKSQRYYAVQMLGRPRSKAVRFSIGNETGQDVRYELGGRSFGLAPRVTRTHEQCAAATLTIVSGPDALSVEPADGRHYTLERAAGSRLRLRLD